MFHNFSRFVHTKIQNISKIVYKQVDLSDKVINYTVPVYLTHPISGKETNIPFKMYNEVHNNYYPKKPYNNNTKI